MNKHVPDITLTGCFTDCIASTNVHILNAFTTGMANSFQRIISQLGYKKQILSLNHVRVMVPGLPYTAFDAFEFPAPWNVHDIMISTQVFAGAFFPGDQTPSLLNLNTFMDPHLCFSVASIIDFYDPLYNKHIVKAPLHIDNRVSYMGKTSLVIDSEMKSGITTLARCRHQQLCMDKANKRPVPIPDWLRESCDSGDPIRFLILEKPFPSHVTRVSIGRVQCSDTDSNFHVKFSNYLKFCINGIFSTKMSYSESVRHTQPPKVKSAFMWFRKECYLGDSLDIEFWNHETKASTICVDMLRENESVFQCILEFHETERLKSSL